MKQIKGYEQSSVSIQRQKRVLSEQAKCYRFLSPTPQPQIINSKKSASFLPTSSLLLNDLTANRSASPQQLSLYQLRNHRAYLGSSSILHPLAVNQQQQQQQQSVTSPTLPKIAQNNDVHKQIYQKRKKQMLKNKAIRNHFLKLNQAQLNYETPTCKIQHFSSALADKFALDKAKSLKAAYKRQLEIEKNFAKLSVQEQRLMRFKNSNLMAANIDSPMIKRRKHFTKNMNFQTTHSSQNKTHGYTTPSLQLESTSRPDDDQQNSSSSGCSSFSSENSGRKKANKKKFKYSKVYSKNGNAIYFKHSQNYVPSTINENKIVSSTPSKQQLKQKQLNQKLYQEYKKKEQKNKNIPDDAKQIKEFRLETIFETGQDDKHQDQGDEQSLSGDQVKFGLQSDAFRQFNDDIPHISKKKQKFTLGQQKEEHVLSRKDKITFKDYFNLKGQVEELAEYDRKKMKNDKFLRIKNLEGGNVQVKNGVHSDKLHYWKGEKGDFKLGNLEQWLNAIKAKVGGLVEDPNLK